MRDLSNHELSNISGGISKALLVGLGFGLTFVVSIIYGFIYPNKC